MLSTSKARLKGSLPAHCSCESSDWNSFVEYREAGKFVPLGSSLFAVSEDKPPGEAEVSFFSLSWVVWIGGLDVALAFTRVRGSNTKPPIKTANQGSRYFPFHLLGRCKSRSSLC